ncbi:MAG TPA: hypothetical protein VNA89_11395 [Gemmatimonadaceae bacterium]|nr:hypothetical protein [Gemmatimonadaceae bacterium]
MERAFQFEAGGRAYTCRVEAARTPRTTPWWWFEVSGDGQRYAPFHAAPDDTEESVAARIVAYYDALLARRAAPREPWGRRGQTTTTAAAGAPAAAAPTPTPSESEE